MGWNVIMFLKNLMVLLIFSKVQSFTITLPSTSVVKGQNYRMTCSYTGTIPGSVSFRKNDIEVCQNLNPGGSCSEAETPGYHCGCINSRHLYLNITQVAKTDDAVWKCTNNFGTGSTNSPRLEVYYGPESLIMTPATIGTVIEGGDMTRVTCSADCKPTCSITWSFSGSVIPTNNGVLQLTNITRTQHGGYTCMIHNTQIPALDKTQIITVIVHYGPDPIQFKPDITSITVTEGDNTVITCSADCRPSCNIKWKAGNSEISSSGKLALPNINRTQHGDYVCIVTNLQILNSERNKTLTVNVNYPPKPSTLIVAAISGGIAVVVITIVIVVIIIYKRRTSKDNIGTPSSSKHELEMEDNHQSVGRDNPGLNNQEVETMKNDLYEGSDTLFGCKPDVVPGKGVPGKNEEGGIFGSGATAVPSQAEPVYGQVNKPKVNKGVKKKDNKKTSKSSKPPPVPPKIDENAKGLMKRNEGIYENTGKAEQKKPRRPNVEGLNYVDVNFLKQGKKGKIHGETDTTIYAGIAHGKKGKPPPSDSDSDEEPAKK